MLTKRVQWRDNDVRCLLIVWARHIRELRLNKRNKHVYDVMANEMHRKNLPFSSEEIRTKIKNLTKRFRAEQKLLAAGRPSTGEWQFFKPIGNVLCLTGSTVPKNGFVNDEDDADEDSCSEAGIFDVDVAIKSEPEDSASCSSVTDPLPVVVNNRNRRLPPSGPASPISLLYNPVPEPLPNSFQTYMGAMPPTDNRRLNAIHEEILDEVRRANQIAEDHHRETNRLLRHTNEIAERNLELYKDFFDFLKTKL